MDDASLIPSNSSDKSEDKQQSTGITVKKYPIPSYQDVLTKIQQQSIEHEQIILEAQKEDIELKSVEDFTTLLQVDKAKAQRIIQGLVSSAREITSTIANTLTSVPIHPYEKLIYEYLGPNFKPRPIQDYSIPDDYNSYKSIKDLRMITEANNQLQMTHMAQITAEAMQPTFNGTFAVDNLNHAFAEPIVGPDGKTQFVINEVRLKEHLEFVEMVKAIPIDYILKNPIEVAKKMLSEFTRIHKPSKEIPIEDEISVPQFTLDEMLKNPMEVSKKMFENYQQLHGPGCYDFAELFKNYENSKVFQQIKTTEQSTGRP